MAKSIKLKNDNYIDSTGVVHNRGLLSTLLDNITGDISDITTLLSDLITCGNDYIKFSNGTLICWGTGNFTTATGGVGFYETHIDFPVSFKDRNSYSVSFTETDQWETGKIATLGKPWSSGASMCIFSNTPSWGFSYIAIGRWK